METCKQTINQRIAKINEAIKDLEAKGFISLKDYKSLLNELIDLAKELNSLAESLNIGSAPKNNDPFVDTWPGDDINNV